jgi:hypothetical protein
MQRVSFVSEAEGICTQFADSQASHLPTLHDLPARRSPFV